jgi:hypothetical protein
LCCCGSVILLLLQQHNFFITKKEHSFSTQNYDAKPTQKCVGAENPPDVFSRNLRGAVLENPEEYFNMHSQFSLSLARVRI